MTPTSLVQVVNRAVLVGLALAEQQAANDPNAARWTAQKWADTIAEDIREIVFASVYAALTNHAHETHATQLRLIEAAG